jgi:phage-related protein
MPQVGRRCHELRIVDVDVAWRIICRVDHDAILILEVFRKLTPHTPAEIISTCRQRLRSYDHA